MSNMIAAGAYLRALREGQRLTRAEVAASAGTNEMQIIRIEKGEIDTRGSLLMALVRAVRGSADHIAHLLLNGNATAEDGEQLAYKWLSKEDVEMLDAIPDDEIQEALAILEELRHRQADQLPVAVRLLRALTGR